MAHKKRTKRASKSATQSLKLIPATRFENLVFDLAVARGLDNARWRTPGADGGRDIEGEFYRTDFSGDWISERWYIECKRYTSAVDWPTVFGKLAYAKNQGADYLVLATTSFPSPACRTEIERHNSRNQRPIIRVWDGSILAAYLFSVPELAVKYGFATQARESAKAFLDLALIVTRAVHSSYGHYAGTSILTSQLEFAASAADLLLARFEASHRQQRWTSRDFKQSRDGYLWCNASGDSCKIDKYAVRCALAFVRYVTAKAKLNIAIDTGSVTLAVNTAKFKQTEKKTLRIVSIWGDCSIKISNHNITLKRR